MRYNVFEAEQKSKGTLITLEKKAFVITRLFGALVSTHYVYFVMK